MSVNQTRDALNLKQGPDSAKEICYICVLAILILLGNLPLFFGKTYQDLNAFGNDYLASVIYAFNELGNSLRHGQFLLWGTSIGCGEPELAFYGSAYSYPLSIISSLFDFPWRFILFCLAHFELVGILSFLVFRRLGISRPSALLAAGWNAMSGYTTWISQVPSVLALLPWFYLVIYLLLKPGELAKAKNFALLTFAFAMMILAGEAEEMVYAAYFGGLFLICFWLAGRELFSGKTLALILIGLGLAVIICLDQVLPFLNLISRTERAEKLPFELYLSSYFSISQISKGLIGLFSRQFLNLYLSFFALTFFIWGIFRRGKSAAWTAGLITLLALVLVLTLPTIGLGKIVYHIPLYFHFVRHYKLGFVLQFVILVFAGIGVDRFISLLVSGKGSQGRALIMFSVFCVIGFAMSMFNPWLLLPLALAFLIWIFPWLRSRPAIALGILLAVDLYPYLWHPPYKLYELKLPSFWARYKTIAKSSEGRDRIEVFYPGISLLGQARENKLPPQVTGFPGGQSFDFYLSFPPRQYAVLLSMINPDIKKPPRNFLDIRSFSLPFKTSDYINLQNRHLLDMLGLRWLFLHDFALSETDRRSIIYDPKYFLMPPSRLIYSEYREKDSKEGEIVRPAFSPRDPGGFHYQSVFSEGDVIHFGVVSDHPAWFLLFAENGGPKNLLFAMRQSPGSAKEGLSARLPTPCAKLRFVNLEQGEGRPLWIDPQILNPKKTIKYMEGDDPQLFENTQAMPRGWIVHDSELFKYPWDLAKALSDPKQFEPRKTVFLLAPRMSPLRQKVSLAEASAGLAASERVELKEYRREYVRINAHLQNPGWLVWIDQYYPGWVAMVDGKEQRILWANLCFRAVKLDEGNHEIVFRFHPLDFRIGLYFSIVSGILLAGLFCAAAGKKKP